MNAIEEKRAPETLGVLGGMGALASAEFLRTIYEENVGAAEQDAPVVMLYSDPTFPDRTDAFLRGEAQLVNAPLIEALNRLSQLGAKRIVMCCMTIHYLVPGLPAELKERIVSLMETIFDNVERDSRRYLMICSTGTRRLGLFEEHARWNEVKDSIVFPDEQEQDTLHRIIYRMKNGDSIPQMKSYIESLLDKYQLKSFIAGCSEIHLLSKQYPSPGESAEGYSCIDPLLIIARELGVRK
ncbi:MAG: aspartate racemase [Blastocatellia bacterium]|jgi:aspartate racemase|nr:aspartate racemase [Blastocatellia bacterium]